MCSCKQKKNYISAGDRLIFVPIMKTSCSLYYFHFRFGTRNAHKLRTIDFAIIGRHLFLKCMKLHITIAIIVRVHNELLIISQNFKLSKNSKY